MTSVASSLPSLDNYPSAFSSFHSSLPSLPPSHYSTAFSSKGGGGVYGHLLSGGGGGESLMDEPPRITANDFNDSIHNSSNNGGNIGVGDNDNYNYYQGYDNNQNAVGGDLVSDILLNDPLKSSYTSINLNFDNNETGVFDGHFLSNFSSSTIGNGGTLPSNAPLAPPSLNQFTNNHSAFSARISLNNGAMLNNGPLLSTNDGDDYHHNAEDLERLQIDLERLNVNNTNASSFNQSPSLSTLPSLSNLSSATTAGFSSYWSSGYSSSPPSSIAPIDAFYNPSMIDSKKSLQLQQSLQGVHINGVSLNANAPAFSPTHGGPGGQEGVSGMGMINGIQRSQSEGGVINQQLLLQQQQNQMQRTQLQNALAPLSSSAPASTAPNNAPSQSSPPPTAPANGSSSPSSSSASSATVSLSSVAGGLNPSTLLASAESPHALSLLETLLGVSPLANLLTMEDIDKSVQLRCVLLELDRSYKEIVHLKQENMNLQKNIDKCIKVMNLQDVDQYVNNLARIYSNNGPQGGAQQERAPKHNNYNKYSSHGQHHNNQFNGGNTEGAPNESEAASDHSVNHGAASGNHGGKRVYYGPSSSNFRGGRGGGGGYRGGRGGQRGYSNAPRE